jgi:hypothetical protein
MPESHSQATARTIVNRLEVEVDQGHQRRLEEIAEIRAQIERMRQTSQQMRSRLRDLALRLQQGDEPHDPG